MIGARRVREANDAVRARGQESAAAQSAPPGERIGRALGRAAGFVRNLGVLAVGHAVGRLCSLALMAVVGRELGAQALGELALGQTLSQYVRMGSEFGTTQIGARLVARTRASARNVLDVIVRKRARLTAVAVVVGLVYAWLGPVPAGSRRMLAVFAVSGGVFGFSLEWLMWGMERYGAIACAQVAVAVIYLAGAIGAIVLGARLVLLWIAVAYGAAVVFGAGLLWALWQSEAKDSVPMDAQALKETAMEAGWGPVAILGSAVLVNQLFQTVDVLLLGALGGAVELGRYSAGRRILFTIFGIYYIATQAAFPMVARAGRTPERYRALAKAVGAAAAVGAIVAAVMALYAREILALIYGPRLEGAAAPLRVLALSCPLEFAAAMLATVLVADGRNGLLLGSLGAATVADAAGILLWVPRHGAEGAAWAKLLSYVILLAATGLLMGKTSRPRLATGRRG